MNPAGRALKAQRAQLVRINAELRVTAVEDGPPSVHFRDPAQLVVLAVQNDRSVRLHVVKALGFRMEHAVPVTQELKVAFSDIRDDHRIRLGRVGQLFHLAEVADPHLEHRDIVFLRETEDGQRQSEVIIEIARCLQNPVFPRKNGRDHFLRAGLAYGSCNPDHRNPQRPAVESGDFLNRLRRRVHTNAGECRFFFFSLGQSQKRAGLHRLRDEIVSVRTGSAHRNIEAARLRFAAVDRHRRHLPVQNGLRSEIGSSAGMRDIARRHLLHPCFSSPPMYFLSET